VVFVIVLIGVSMVLKGIILFGVFMVDVDCNFYVVKCSGCNCVMGDLKV